MPSVENYHRSPEEAQHEYLIDSLFDHKVDFRRDPLVPGQYMTFAISALEQSARRRVSVYFTLNGGPDMFAIPEPGNALIVMSVRYMQVCAHFQDAMNQATAVLQEEAFRQVLCRGLAEVSAITDPDFAMRCFLRSLPVNAGVLVAFRSRQDFAMSDLYSYSAASFFPLFHEGGHLVAADPGFRDGAELLPDDHLRAGLEGAVDDLGLGVEVGAAVTSQFFSLNEASASALADLREEILVDRYALWELFKTTRALAEREGQSGFDLSRFLSEAFLFNTIIATISTLEQVRDVRDRSAAERNIAVGLRVATLYARTQAFLMCLSSLAEGLMPDRDPEDANQILKEAIAPAFFAAKVLGEQISPVARSCFEESESVSAMLASDIYNQHLHNFAPSRLNLFEFVTLSGRRNMKGRWSEISRAVEQFL